MSATVAEPTPECRQQCPRSEKRQVIEGVPALPGKCARPPGRSLSGAAFEASRRPPSARCRQPVKAEPRCRERGRPGIVGRLQMLLKLSELGQSGFPQQHPPGRLSVSRSPSKTSRPQDLLIREREQTRPQCQQMAREVPAVHRRDIGRQQRFQRLRVVPVVEVASVPFQRFHRVERIRRALDELSGRNIAEVVRGQIREQRQSHVGRRRAMRDHGNGMLLIVIRRQPMIFRTDEGLEERPGLSGKLPEKDSLAASQTALRGE